MVLTITRFSEFKHVEAMYNNITPLGGMDNKGKDIRPIGDRRRKWERIARVSANCYALSDGYHFGDEHFPSWAYGTDTFTPSDIDMANYAPIVWRKKRDGTEEVTVRNGWGQGSHTSRYAFLDRHLPAGMYWVNNNGKHFIKTNNNGELHYLAKTRTVPRAVYDAIQNVNSNHYWQKRLQNWVRLQDDNSALTFTKNSQGVWVLVDGGKEAPTPPKVTVRKEVKAKYKEQITKFKEWAFTMGAMLPIADYQYARDIYKEIQDWIAEQEGGKPHYWGDPMNLLDFKVKRQIMCAEEHPMRLHMAVSMLRNIEFYNAGDENEARRIKQRANTWINNHMGFTKKG